MASADVVTAAMATIRIAHRQGPLVPRQEAMVRKLDGILQGVGIDTKAIVGDLVLDIDALRASGFDIDALAGDLRQTMLCER